MDDNMENNVVEEAVFVDGKDDIKISEEVIATIAGVAIKDIPGLYGVSKGFATGISEAILGKKNFSKGVKVDSDGVTVKIALSIVVEFGARIPEVATKIRERVIADVESMTGLKVTQINIAVQGIHTSEEKETKIEE